MNMIAVLDPSGTLILYTGGVLVSKVHIPNTITGNTPSSKIPTTTNQNKSPNTSFPRRSSLLPTAQKPGDATFEDELHLLSPVHPLQPPFLNRLVWSNVDYYVIFTRNIVPKIKLIFCTFLLLSLFGLEYNKAVDQLSLLLLSLLFICLPVCRTTKPMVHVSWITGHCQQNGNEMYQITIELMEM